MTPVSSTESEQRVRDAFEQSVEAWQSYVDSPLGLLRHRAITHFLANHLPGSGLRILDAGSGSGELAAELTKRRHTVTLLDWSEAMLREARARCAGWTAR